MNTRIIIFFFICTSVLLFCQSQSPFKARTEIPESILTAPAWNGRKFQDNPNHFQFVITSDRTGGMRPGVFASAIPKINLLQPEFVISIGDLIDGYTEDRSLVASQWEEFEKIVRRLNMPFFHIPGNHDISNKMMEEFWIEKTGASYYHFRFKDVLFLCLNTEEQPDARISLDQVHYFEDVLDKHKDVRWTMVFMHRPLWMYGNTDGYENIAELLSTRPYTLFSGHEHTYLKSEIDGQRHYVLGTTGGESNLRHSALGELDHIMWITMTDMGPIAANLTLDGILPDDLVTDSTRPMTETLRSGSWLNIPPVVTQEDVISEIQLPVILKNPTDSPLAVRDEFVLHDQFYIYPNIFETEVAPGDTRQIQFTLSFSDPIHVDHLDNLSLSFSGGYQIHNDELITVPRQHRILLDYVRRPDILPFTVRIDGSIDEWTAADWSVTRNPQYIKENWDWSGPSDGWFAHAVALHNETLVLAVETFDDQLILGSSSLEPAQDQLWIFCQARKSHPSIIEADSAGVPILQLQVGPGPEPNLPFLEYPENLPADVMLAMSLKDDGFVFEMGIPLRMIRDAEGELMNNVRLNIAFMDHDNPRNIKPSVLWWRPPWDHSANYNESGWFIIDTP